MARHPYIDTVIGQSYASYEPFRSWLATRPSGSLETADAMHGAVCILAYRSVGDLPLVVTVGLGKEAVLAGWQQRALVTAGGAFGIVLLGTAFLLLLMQRQRQRAAMALQLAQAQKLDAVGRTAAGIVHDFRNLLAVMAGGARLIRRRLPDARLAPILDEIDAAVERGSALSAKLLAFSRQQDLELEVVDVDRLLRGLQPLMKCAAGSAVRLELELAPEVWPCRLDRAQFDHVLLNLIINARDAMPQGGVIRVTSANQPRRGRGGQGPLAPGDHVRIAVVDNGQGMTPEVLQRALEPFFTTKGERGTGLGLSQAYRFVREVGGDLHIESTPGEGTTVQLFFPRHHADTPPVKRAQGVPADASPNSPPRQPEGRAAQDNRAGPDTK
jgi:two-component system, NtrC family, sensor kinase